MSLPVSTMLCSNILMVLYVLLYEVVDLTISIRITTTSCFTVKHGRKVNLTCWYCYTLKTLTLNPASVCLTVVLTILKEVHHLWSAPAGWYRQGSTDVSCQTWELRGQRSGVTGLHHHVSIQTPALVSLEQWQRAFWGGLTLTLIFWWIFAPNWFYISSCFFFFFF